MKTHLHFLICLFSIILVSTQLLSQEPSARVDFESSNQVVLVPRTDTSTVNASFTPALGLLIFQTSDSTFYFHNGHRWDAVTKDFTPDNLGNHIMMQNL